MYDYMGALLVQDASMYLPDVEKTLERKSGILHGALDRILNGQNKTVTLTTIYKLARGFDMTYMEFLDDDVFRSELIEID